MSTRARATSMRAVRHGQQRTLLDRILRWLYGAGEQGIAVPDLTPGNGFLFQDSAGITPVTAFEQPVGLILDRSKGATPGPERVTNGDFSNGATGWTTKAGASITGGALSINTTGDTLEIAAQQNVIQQFKWYKVSVTCTSISSGTIFVALASAVTTQRVAITSAGTIEALIYNANTLTGIDVRAFGSSGGTGAVVGVIANISVRELPGNHVIQATSTKRPTLSARYNLLTYSEDFSNAAWVKVGLGTGSVPVVTPDVVVAPDGTTTADLVVFNRGAGNTISDQSYIVQTPTLVSGTYIQAVWLKAATAGDVGKQLALRNAAGGGYGVITLTSNWVRYTRTETGSSANWEINSRGTVTADNTVSAHVWGADLRLTIDTIGQPAYQRVGAATDYDTAGFFPYLRFDGTDDSMATAASVDFTGTDKMTVFAGVTKLANSARGVIGELSAVATNPGSFLIDWPSFGSNSSSFYLDGGASIVTSNSGAPLSQVISCVFNRSASTIATRIVPRLNGAVDQTVLSDFGASGNFGNYSLFLGARNNASLFFNGRLYPFFIRGAATDAGLISQTEQFLKTRMPVNF